MEMKNEQYKRLSLIHQYKQVLLTMRISGYYIYLDYLHSCLFFEIPFVPHIFFSEY